MCSSKGNYSPHKKGKTKNSKGKLKLSISLFQLDIKEEEEKAKEAGKVFVPRKELTSFEKEINGKKHKIDESFLSQFGIKLD